MPASEPIRKPMRRPMCFMAIDSGKVVSAVPITQVDCGKVAQLLSGASCAPTRPEVATSIVVVEP